MSCLLAVAGFVVGLSHLPSSRLRPGCPATPHPLVYFSRRELPRVFSACRAVGASVALVRARCSLNDHVSIASVRAPLQVFHVLHRIF